MDRRLLRAPEVAQILNIPEDTVYDMGRRSLLPVVRVGRLVRFDEAKLFKWIADGGQALPGGWRQQPGGAR